MDRGCLLLINKTLFIDYQVLDGIMGMVGLEVYRKRV